MTHLAYGSQVRRDLTGPLVPIQHIHIRIKGIKYINNPLVTITQNKKDFWKSFEESVWFQEKIVSALRPLKRGLEGIKKCTSCCDLGRLKVEEVFLEERWWKYILSS